MNLVWLRNDLRRMDNPALFYACEHTGPVVALVTLTPEQWRRHDESPWRMALWLQQLAALSTRLEALNIPLRLLEVPTFAEVPDALALLCQDLGVENLWFNYEYPLNERHRDAKVCALLERQGVQCRGFHAELIIPPGQIRNGQGTPFKVFTPYSRRWRQVLQQLYLQAPLPLPARQAQAACASDSVPAAETWLATRFADAIAPDSTRMHSLWPVGEEVVHQRLLEFVQQRERQYAQQRDFPFRDQTSRISPYLTLGAVSPRQCLFALMQQYQDDRWLDSTWLTELIWREFYRHLLVDFPEQSRWQPFRPEVEARIHWQEDERLFQAWCQGETGYPIVDAAMKQLLATGWMHNRLRMIVGSFLTKLLRQDWRKGAAFFMQHLIDGDFASNLGGWQWCASVGADAAPYFRIFNPQLQSEKFDPSGEFLAQWLPELRQVSAKARHLPGAGQALGRPAPIVDYRAARAAALADYQQAS
ncbi:cryptochrome/photolyase family protein [Nitrincola tapanii]|uniref:Deoxyribodipyrimidine photo-lyase n=1 Tax=Nitrincola tapanii TaxID=1708751 RepID=A0A5A9W5H8_9GAMM|nr:FAD-binding domain-containing protein [Nitrincola tapanii]KAA0875704.1 deoxyribodipyrimidine photo-lyase [Nitrincola tapanii]